MTPIHILKEYIESNLNIKTVLDPIHVQTPKEIRLLLAGMNTTLTYYANNHAEFDVSFDMNLKFRLSGANENYSLFTEALNHSASLSLFMSLIELIALPSNLKLDTLSFHEIAYIHNIQRKNGTFYALESGKMYLYQEEWTFTFQTTAFSESQTVNINQIDFNYIQ